MTYPISIAKARARTYADIANPVDGKVQIVMQYDDVLDAVAGRDPSMSPQAWIMLPPGKEIGEELLVTFLATTTNNSSYRDLRIGINSPDVPYTAESERYFFYRPGSAPAPWLMFDRTFSYTGMHCIFLKWVPHGWNVITTTLGVYLADDTQADA